MKYKVSQQRRRRGRGRREEGRRRRGKRSREVEKRRGGVERETRIGTREEAIREDKLLTSLLSSSPFLLAVRSHIVTSKEKEEE